MLKLLYGEITFDEVRLTVNDKDEDLLFTVCK